MFGLDRLHCTCIRSIIIVTVDGNEVVFRFTFVAVKLKMSVSLTESKVSDGTKIVYLITYLCKDLN